MLRNACFLCAGSPVERSPAPNRDRALPARIAREIAVDDVATRGPNTIYEADFVKAVRPAPKSRLSRLSDEAIDLLVMGAYGHSRLREMVLGGVTREVFQQMTVPVLMSH